MKRTKLATVHDVPPEHGEPGTTARQLVMARWIRAFVAVAGRAPTLKEIAKAHGMTVGSAWCYLRALRSRKVDIGPRRRMGRPVGGRVGPASPQP
jgi:LexA DNA binding domain